MGSEYSPIPCYNTSLNNQSSFGNWSANDLGSYYTSGMRTMFGNVKALTVTVPQFNGSAPFSALYLPAPRAGNYTLTIVTNQLGLDWTTFATITVTSGTPFALAIKNIVSFQSYDPQMNASVCPTTLTSIFFIEQNSPLPQIQIIFVDRMANECNISANEYSVSANSFYVSDISLTVGGHISQSAPVQQGNTFSFTGISLTYLHGVSFFINFSCADPELPIWTMSPPIRTKLCPSGTYKEPLTAICPTCPSSGASCNGSEIVTVLPGYWRANGTRTFIYPCTVGAEVCLGSLGTYDQSFCAEGYDGPLCSNCLPGYGHSGSSCVQCPSFGESFAIVAAIVLAVFIVLVLWTIMTLREPETTDVSVIMRTVVNHLQTMGKVGEFATQWGPFLTSLMSSQGTASGSVSINGLQAADCLVRQSGNNYTAVFAAYMTLPLFSILIALVIFGVFRVLQLVPVITKELEAEIEQDIRDFGENARTAIIKKRYPFYMVAITTINVIMFTLYQTLITQCASALTCSSYVYGESASGEPTDTKEFLAVDMTISCSGGISPLVIPALVFAVGYGIGIPAFFTFGYMFVNERLNKPELTKLMFMFLTGGYKDRYFFWQSLIMLRKLVLILGIAFLQSNQQMLNYESMWVMSVALILQVWLQPALKDEHNFIESFSLAVIVMTLNLGFLYFWTGLSTFGSQVLTVVLLLITVGVLGLFVYYLIRAAIPDIVSLLTSITDDVGHMIRWLSDDTKKEEVFQQKKKEIWIPRDDVDDHPAYIPKTRFRGSYSGATEPPEFEDVSDEESPHAVNNPYAFTGVEELTGNE